MGIGALSGKVEVIAGERRNLARGSAKARPTNARRGGTGRKVRRDQGPDLKSSVDDGGARGTAEPAVEDSQRTRAEKRRDSPFRG